MANMLKAEVAYSAASFFLDEHLKRVSCWMNGAPHSRIALQLSTAALSYIGSFVPLKPNCNSSATSIDDAGYVGSGSEASVPMKLHLFALLSYYAGCSLSSTRVRYNCLGTT